MRLWGRRKLVWEGRRFSLWLTRECVKWGESSQQRRPQAKVYSDMTHLRGGRERGDGGELNSRVSSPLLSLSLSYPFHSYSLISTHSLVTSFYLCALSISRDLSCSLFVCSLLAGSDLSLPPQDADLISTRLPLNGSKDFIDETDPSPRIFPIYRRRNAYFQEKMWSKPSKIWIDGLNFIWFAQFHMFMETGIKTVT